MEGESGKRAVYRINRPIYSQPEFFDEFKVVPKTGITVSKVKGLILKLRLSSFGFALLSSIFTLRSFYTARCFLLDVLSGMTMAIFHIPQGMAYGVLAGLKPVNGLYTSFFPVLTYFLFGTSRHTSVGTFSLASLLFSGPVNRLATRFTNHTASSLSTAMADEEYNFRLGVAIMLTFSIGLLQILMGICQLGFLVTYLSGPMISGFICASGFHILASQMSALFGIKLPKVYGPGNLLLQIYNLFAHITETNIATIIISVICIAVLYIFTFLINPCFKKRFKFPIPIEIIIVALSTVISNLAQLHITYCVKIVGEVPKGLPTPILPSFEYFNDVIADIFIIAVVTYAITASLVKVYATDFGYDVLYNQELLALGISNVFGSFFQCHACCGALARSAVVVSMGMASQIASLLSCVIILLILYLIGPYLYDLPTAVLASIIVVALTSTFKKVLDLKHLWKVSLCDASVWLVTFSTTLFIDVPYGLGFGFGYAVLTIVYRSQHGGQYVLANAEGTDLYRNVERFKYLKEIDGIKIICFNGPICFANVDHFTNTVYKLSGVNPLKRRHKLAAKEAQRQSAEEGCHTVLQQNRGKLACCIKTSPFDDEDDEVHNRTLALSSDSPQFKTEDPVDNYNNKISDVTFTNDHENLRHIILDASSWMFTDTVGLRAIKEVAKNYLQIDIFVSIACLQPRLRSCFEKSGVFSVLEEDMIFMTIHDAVLMAKSKIKQEQGNEPQHYRKKSSLGVADSLESPYGEMTDLNILGDTVKPIF